MEGCEMASSFTNLLRNLFAPGSSGASQQDSGETVEYKGYTIRPAARREGAQWLTVGVISKAFADEVKEHQFIRADTYSSKQDADACSIVKARQIIDERGDDLFSDG
jgi:hypothetical protein